MRLFVAAEIPSTVADSVARSIADLRRRFGGVRWEDASKYHFTLKFLGEVEEKRLPDVTSAVDRSSLHVGPFPVRLRGLGFFPPGARPRVVWVGVGAGAEGLARLAEGSEREFVRLGFPREGRPYSAHLTVGRVKGPGDGPRLAEALAPRGAEEVGDPFAVERLVLFESRLLPGGSRYAIVHASALGAEGARG
ncbi:MAG TPA: RNA 2',3'-cyclic phosphodiesterase [Planctomycetota bacterium]|nr:RNA 2',3'-cyclic phosphodiesterase [Planctomycetota bacterium]